MIEKMVSQRPLDRIEVGHFSDPRPGVRVVGPSRAGSRASCSSCGNQTGRDAALCPWCGRVALKDAASDPEASGMRRRSSALVRDRSLHFSDMSLHERK